MSAKFITKKYLQKTKSRTDWARIRAMKDEDIDYSDDPETTEEFWKDAVVVPPGKIAISARIDDDVVAWFKRQGPGYQTRMNAVLRAYMQHQKRKAKRRRR